MKTHGKYWATVTAVACVTGWVASASATAIRVDLTTRYAQPKMVLQTEASEPLAMDSVAMLFWTATRDFNGFNVREPIVPLSGDLLLATLPTTGLGPPVPGHITNLDFAAVDFKSADLGVDLPSGFVYVAVFNLPYASFLENGVPLGTWYSLAPTDPFDVEDKPDATFLPDDVGLVITEDGPFIMTHMTVPEPGIFVMLGIASLLLLVRRRMTR